MPQPGIAPQGIVRLYWIERVYLAASSNLVREWSEASLLPVRPKPSLSSLLYKGAEFYVSRVRGRPVHPFPLARGRQQYPQDCRLAVGTLLARHTPRSVSQSGHHHTRTIPHVTQLLLLHSWTRRFFRPTPSSPGGTNFVGTLTFPVPPEAGNFPLQSEPFLPLSPPPPQQFLPCIPSMSAHKWARPGLLHADSTSALSIRGYPRQPPPASHLHHL